MRQLLHRIISRYKTALNSRCSRTSQRQMFLVYTFLLSIILFTCVINLLSLSGPTFPFIRYLISALIVVNIVGGALYYFRKITLYTAFATLILSSFAETAIEMVVLSYHISDYGMMLIMGNVSLLVIAATLPIVAYARRLPYIVGMLSMLTYVVCTLISRSNALFNFMIIFVFIFAFISVFGEMIVRNYLASEQENRSLKHNEETMLSFLRMSREEMNSFIRLSKDNGLDMYQTEQLIEALNPQTKQRLMNTLYRYTLEKQSDTDRMKAALPELTDSEIEICRLIYQDKKLSEMSRILSKTPSNITCQRTNIRAKLHLSKTDSLKEAIDNRINH